jgi:hypothetical protein
MGFLDRPLLARKGLQVKVEKFVCDLCGDDAEYQIKMSTLGEKVTRGALKANDAQDLCSGCYRDITLFLDSLTQTAGQ